MKTPTKTLKAKFNAAFSLVELLVVIAVIAVIAAIAIPNITGTREAAQAAQASYDAATVTRLANQALAAGATAPADGNWTNALQTGVTVTITNNDGTTQDVVFKLD